MFNEEWRETEPMRLQRINLKLDRNCWEQGSVGDAWLASRLRQRWAGLLLRKVMPGKALLLSDSFTGPHLDSRKEENASQRQQRNPAAGGPREPWRLWYEQLLGLEGVAGAKAVGDHRRGSNQNARPPLGIATAIGRGPTPCSASTSFF